MRVAAEVVLSVEECEALTTLADAADTSPRLAQRVHIVLLAAKGMQNKDIADQLGLGRAQVARWRERYVQQRLPGIENNLPRGAPPVKVDLAQLAELTARGRPDSPEPWSTRTLAETLGVSAATISRHWKAMGQEPPVRHRTRAPVASDLADVPDFTGRIVDIVGLYVHGGEHALVVASRAPDATLAVDDGARRVGMTALVDALRMLDRNHDVPAADAAAPAAVRPWLIFLRKVERAAHGDATLHVLCDNYSSQMHPAVRRWLAQHSRFQTCLTRPSTSWPRAVQRWLRTMDTNTLRHAMRTMPDLLTCVTAYLENTADTQPFVWLAPAADMEPVTAVTAPDVATAIDPHEPHEPPPPIEPASHDLVACIDAGRLTPPRMKDAVLSRDALMARLQDARRHRCVVVHGQAGSGKTTTMLAWRRLLLSIDYDVTWLSLGADDNAPAHFCTSLLASIAQADPAVLHAVVHPQGVAPEQAESADAVIENWIISLVQGLARHPRELVLILDDLHRVSNPRIFQAVQWLIDYAPSNVHVVLGSRTTLPLSLERIRARGLLTEVGIRDLRFTAEETERFLSAQLGGIDPRDAAEIYRFTDGWAMGLQRVVTELRGRSHPDRQNAQARVVTALTGYFEREVLTVLPSDDLQWLTSTALCQRLCGPLCAAVLGRSSDAAALSARLARLDSDQQFVTRDSDSDSGHDTWYRLHPLLRDVLAARLDVMPASTHQALHTAAAAWFRSHGMVDEAVHHAVQAGDVDTAARMVEACAYDLLSRGDLSRLVSLLRRLPEPEQRGRFGLLLVSAYYAMYTSRFHAAQECLARIAAQRKTLDSRQRYAEALIRAGLALQQDDVDTVLAMVPSLRDGIPAEADDFSWSCRSNILGWAYIYQGQYDQARAVVDEASARGAGTRSRLLGDCIAAMSVAVAGRPDAAEQTVRELLEKADARGTDAIGLSCMTAGLLADILYEVNDTEAAVRLLESRMNLLERASLPDTVLHACRVLARAHWLAGRRAQAMACIDRLEAYADRFGMDRLLAEAHALRLRYHHELGEMQGASSVLRQLEAVGKRHADDRTETARRVLAIVRQARDAMLLPLRDYATCAVRLAQALEAGSLHPVRQAGLEMQLALAQHHVGRPQAAHSHLTNALSLGHRFGLVRTLLDAAPDLPTQIDAILDATSGKAGPLDPVLAFYVTQLRAEAATTSVIVLGHGGARTDTASADLLSEREREVLDLAAQAMPNKKIAMVLGLAQETVKWHLKNIYAKLGVAGRGGAAARLRDLIGTPKRES